MKLQDEPLRTKKEAAKFLRVSEPTIDRMRQDGRLPYIKIGAGVRFLDRDIASFVSGRRVKSVAGGSSR